MEFKEGFNPGENNTYNEINFGPNSQYLPNVTELTIINGGTQEDKRKVAPQKEEAQKCLYDCMAERDTNKDVTVAKTAILKYVDRIAFKLKPEWMQGWHRFWEGLLNIDVIEKEICKISKQQGTTFNRMLICNIIYYLGKNHFFKDKYHPSDMARALEGNDQQSIRSHGLNMPPGDIIRKRIDNYIENYNL